MENKLNQASLSKYSKDYVKVFCTELFKSTKKLSGPDILKLKQSKQVNLLIVMNLFNRWNEERRQLMSPYFDFNAKEVQEQMDELMNVLSRNISISEKDFKPLLEEAVKDTITLIFDPFTWMHRAIGKLQNVGNEEIASFKKYIKTNAGLITGLEAKVAGRTVGVLEAQEFLKKVWQEMDEELDDTLPHIKALSEVSAPDLDILYTNNVGHSVKDQIREKVSSNAPANQPKKEEAGGNQSKTFYDTIAVDSKRTLADIHSHKKIESLSKIMTINQKFMFTNELFDGNREEFIKALDAFDACANYDEAEGLLSSKYVDKYNWNLDSEQVGEFLELIARRFGV
ncbi:hypothetical protein [Peijinzhouia sedimentorum]